MEEKTIPGEPPGGMKRHLILILVFTPGPTFPPPGIPSASTGVTASLSFPGTVAVTHTVETVNKWICDSPKFTTESSVGTLLAAHGPPGPAATALST